jgi:hypothetical protein
METNYYKYLKYKHKYIIYKNKYVNQFGGGITKEEIINAITSSSDNYLFEKLIIEAIIQDPMIMTEAKKNEIISWISQDKYKQYIINLYDLYLLNEYINTNFSELYKSLEQINFDKIINDLLLLEMQAKELCIKKDIESISDETQKTLCNMILTKLNELIRTQELNKAYFYKLHMYLDVLNFYTKFSKIQKTKFPYTLFDKSYTFALYCNPDIDSLSFIKHYMWMFITFYYLTNHNQENLKDYIYITTIIKKMEIYKDTDYIISQNNFLVSPSPSTRKLIYTSNSNSIGFFIYLDYNEITSKYSLYCSNHLNLLYLNKEIVINAMIFMAKLIHENIKDKVIKSPPIAMPLSEISPQALPVRKPLPEIPPTAMPLQEISPQAMPVKPLPVTPVKPLPVTPPALPVTSVKKPLQLQLSEIPPYKPRDRELPKAMPPKTPLPESPPTMSVKPPLPESPPSKPVNQELPKAINPYEVFQIDGDYVYIKSKNNSMDKDIKIYKLECINDKDKKYIAILYIKEELNITGTGTIDRVKYILDININGIKLEKIIVMLSRLSRSPIPLNFLYNNKKTKIGYIVKNDTDKLTEFNLRQIDEITQRIIALIQTYNTLIKLKNIFLKKGTTIYVNFIEIEETLNIDSKTSIPNDVLKYIIYFYLFVESLLQSVDHILFKNENYIYYILNTSNMLGDFFDFINSILQFYKLSDFKLTVDIELLKQEYQKIKKGPSNNIETDFKMVINKMMAPLSSKGAIIIPESIISLNPKSKGAIIKPESKGAIIKPESEGAIIKPESVISSKPKSLISLLNPRSWLPGS